MGIRMDIKSGNTIAGLAERRRVRLVLASQSPRRKELLTRAGLEPEVIVSGIPEKTEETEPEKVVMDLSGQKAEHVADELNDVQSQAGRPDQKPEAADADGSDPITLVIGADTVVCVDGRILGKPHSHEEAGQMIRLIAGRTHQVYSGVTILKIDGEKRSRTTWAERTDVSVYPMSDQEIHDYAFSEEPMDKAGAYGIQGAFGRYIQKIRGDYSSVVGLPVGAVYQNLKKMLQ